MQNKEDEQEKIRTDFDKLINAEFRNLSLNEQNLLKRKIKSVKKIEMNLEKQRDLIDKLEE